MDVRKSLSAMWQLTAAFCRYANSTLLEVLNEFANTPLVGSKLIPEELLRTQTLTALNNVHQTALDSVNRSITSADQITQANVLMTGLSTNAVARLPANGWQTDEGVITSQTEYKRHESTTSCNCIYDLSCPMAGGLYFYDAWQINEIYDLNVIVANVTIPGLVVDCLPIQSMFASTLECFYNQSCLNILLFAYQVNINTSILNTSLSSRFTPTTTLSYLVNELFIDKIFNETIYGSYYQQCAPVYCSYTYSQRFDLVYVITTLIALFGGLNIALHLIAPYLIDCLFFVKKKLFLQNEFQQNETPILTFQNRFHNLVNKLRSVSANDMKVHTISSYFESIPYQFLPIPIPILTNSNSNSNQFQSILELDLIRVGTRLIEGVYIGCFITDAVSQSSLMCWYDDSCMEQLQMIFVSAGVTTFNNATKLNSALNINFPPNTVVQTIIENIMVDKWQSSASYTNFYQKCRPALCSYTYEERSSAIFIITTIIGLFGGLNIALRLISHDGIWFLQSRYDIRVRGAAYFKLLSVLCSISQTTIQNAVNQFAEETFVSAQAVSQIIFFVQTDVIIRQFQTSTTSEFSRALQLIRDMTHGNTFISSYGLNWQWWVLDKSGNSTLPTRAISPTNNCSCGTRSDCVQPGGIYMVGYNFGLYGGISTPNTQMFAMSGFNVGCSSVETLLRSTFECLYNQTCIDLLQIFATTINPVIPNATDYITAMNSSFVSRFQPNTTIVDIVNELFIEQWQINVSYTKFYEQCAPMYCSYTFEANPTFIYIVTRTIGSYIGNRCRNNRVASLT
ncbi:unnamed protein product [Adineta steineri]|nr:unnamed protein product [Adineta steineri]CAF3737382.1 unnamed protein product [Adineta steineri]CAF4020123.1 unnamed protein product [Adineta steineri]